MKFVATAAHVWEVRRLPSTIDCPLEGPAHRERLTEEWASASEDKKIYFVFEHHLLELLPFYKASSRK